MRRLWGRLGAWIDRRTLAQWWLFGVAVVFVWTWAAYELGMWP